MFTVNDDLSIYATRGDVVFFGVTAMQGEEPYIFKAGDVLRMKVMEKKACDNVVMQKDFVIEAPAERVDIFLGEDDTKFGDIISKPVDYWYEVELNPDTAPQTIIGYNEDGPMVFKLYPEGSDLTEDIEEEDIPVVDAELNLTSERPVQNKAVTRGIMNVQEYAEAEVALLKGSIAKIGSDLSAKDEQVDSLATALAFERAKLDNLLTSTTVDGELMDIRLDVDGVVHATAGDAVRAQAFRYPQILWNRTPTWKDQGYFEGELCVCIMGDDQSVPTVETYIYAGSRAWDDTSAPMHYWERIGGSSILPATTE